MARFRLEDQLRQIRHALWVENAVEMIAFVLHDAGVKALGAARDDAAFRVETPIADMEWPLDITPQAGHGEAPLPAALHRRLHDLDLGIDQDGQGSRVVEAFVAREVGVRALVRRLEDHDPKRHMDLGRGKSCPIRVDHGLDHVAHEAADFGGRRVRDGVGAARQDRMAHTGDLENGHAFYMGRRPFRVKRGTGMDRPGGFWYLPPPHGNPRKPEQPLQIIVRDNNIDQALKALKKKMQREGIFREMKLRGHYEKPSEKRARERAEAIRRYRKLQRKRLQREGVIPR
jgi:small subunit ribosomal protein S21